MSKPLDDAEAFLAECKERRERLLALFSKPDQQVRLSDEDRAVVCAALRLFLRLNFGEETR